MKYPDSVGTESFVKVTKQTFRVKYVGHKPLVLGGTWSLSGIHFDPETPIIGTPFKAKYILFRCTET